MGGDSSLQRSAQDGAISAGTNQGQISGGCRGPADGAQTHMGHIFLSSSLWSLILEKITI